MSAAAFSTPRAVARPAGAGTARRADPPSPGQSAARDAARVSVGRALGAGSPAPAGAPVAVPGPTRAFATGPTSSRAFAAALPAPAATAALPPDGRTPARDAAGSAALHGPAPAPAFNWNEQWYACGSLEDFRVGASRHVRLLGEDYVVWRDAAGALRAARDRCVHQGSPLSQGRVLADGRLECRYHAWQFAPSGRCVHNPNAPAPQRCSGQKLRMVPVRAQDGIVYAWPGERSVAADGTATPLSLAPLPAVPAACSRGIATVGVDFVLEGNFGQLLTNALDLAHTATVHRFGPSEARQPLSHCEIEPRADGGFTARGWADGHEVLQATLTPPGTLDICVSPRHGPRVHIRSQLTPRGPNAAGVVEVLHVSRISVEARAAWQNALFHLATAPSLTWWWHLQNLEIAEEDIRAVSHAALRADNEVLPTQHDVPRRAARAWFLAACATGPAWLNADAPPFALRRASAVERFEHHTRDCAHCRPVYDAASLTATLAPPGAIVAAGAAAVGAARGDVSLTTAMATLAGLGALTGLLAGALRRTFERGP